MNGRSASSPRPVPGPFCALYSPPLPLLGARALSLEEEASLREHLADCAWCQNQLAAYVVVEDALRQRYASAPSVQPLTIEDIMRASQSDQQQVETRRQADAQAPRTTDLPGWSGSTHVARGSEPRRPRPWATFGAMAAVALLVVLAAALFANMRLRTPGSAASTSCATTLQGATPAKAIPGFDGVMFPSGASMTPVKSSPGGPSQFTILETDVCFSGPRSGIPTLSDAGWSVSPSFPYQGALLQPCTGQCYQMGNSRYTALDQITDHSNSVFTYHLRLAKPPPSPTCNANFTGSPLQGVQTSVDGISLPPITYAVPDDAPNLRGYDLCSSGTAASVIAFLTSTLPATGWTKASDARCFYADQCWTKGAAAISWHVDDPTNWNIAYRPATA
jgi:hypothetical protein